jgi:hypothetical protein
MIAHLPPYSHGYNLVARLLCFAVGIAGVAPVILALDWIRAATGIEPYIAANEDVSWAVSLAHVGAIFIPLLLAWRLAYRPYFVPTANWLFLRRSRYTNASWADSVALSPLFQLDKDGIWFPVPEVLHMPLGYRLAYLYGLAERTGRLIPGVGPRPIPTGGRPDAAVVGMSVPVSGIERDPELTKAVNRLPDRLVGALMLAIGLLFGYWGVLAPLLAIARHQRNISYHYEAAVATPPILVLGLLYIVLGQRATRLFGLKAGQRPTQLGMVLVAVLVLAGFVLHGWLSVRLEVGG